MAGNGQRVMGNAREWTRGVAALLLPFVLLLGACGEQGGEAERANRDGNRAFRDGDY
jgi:hypothetical protein